MYTRANDAHGVATALANAYCGQQPAVDRDDINCILLAALQACTAKQMDAICQLINAADDASATVLCSSAWNPTLQLHESSSQSLMGYSKVTHGWQTWKQGQDCMVACML
jgi:hypothetical protein